MPFKIKEVYLAHLLSQLESMKLRSAMLFCSTCKGCRLLGYVLAELGVDCTALHSHQSQGRRLAALDKWVALLSAVVHLRDFLPWPAGSSWLLAGHSQPDSTRWSFCMPFFMPVWTAPTCTSSSSILTHSFHPALWQECIAGLHYAAQGWPGLFWQARSPQTRSGLGAW